MAANHRGRISQIKKLFQNSPVPSALLLSSAPRRIFSRDTYYPYRQDSDFFYLTGSHCEDLALIISSNHKRPILIAPKIDPLKIIWEGKPPSYSTLAAAIGAELIISNDINKEILNRVRGHERLYHQNVPGTLSYTAAKKIADTPSHNKNNLPRELAHTDVILEPMRLFKDSFEVKQIKSAAKITNKALFELLPLIKPGTSEAQIAYGLDYHIRMLGGTLAFNTIAAAGPSAAVLHYEHYTRKMTRADMLLIDCGAALNLYNADITRVIPVSGKFSPIHKEIYSVVLEAQKAAISKVKHAALSGAVYNAAAKVITEGLVELGVLRGKTSKLMQKQAFKPYFMHGIGHTLGLDVHDVGSVRGNNKASLKKGMVMTIEPGLYFPKKIGRVPACGVRIEDDVLVTARGCEVLTEGFPKEVDEVEALFS